MALSASERKQIEQELARTKTTTADVVKTISCLTASLVQFKERCYKTMAEIRTAADLIVDEVREHEETLVAQVQEIIDVKESFVEQQKKVLENYIAELQQSIDYTSDVLNIPTTPPNPEIDEWKSALNCQLQDLNNLSKNYNYSPDVSNEAQFLFIYANKGLLKSIANYGAIVNSVPDGFKLKQQDDNQSEDDKGYQTKIPVIPVVTLNGAILDLDRAISDDEESDEESSEDDDDEDDEIDDDDYDSNSSDTDNDVHKDHSEDYGVEQQNLKKNNVLSAKPKLSTLI